MLSVIIPLYNKQELIVNCLSSILSQTELPDEIVIVNDGSTDDSLESAKKFIEKNKNNIKINIINQVNSGVSAARNNGVLASRNNLIAFLDADDEWQPDFIEKMLKLIQQFPDAVMYSSFHRIKDSDGNFFKPKSVLPDDFSGYIENYAKIAKVMPIVHSSKVILRKKEFLEIGGFTVGAVLTEDLLLWFKVSLEYNVAFINEPLIIINQFQDDSRIARANKTPYIIEYYSKNYKEFSILSSSQKDYLYSVYFKHLLGSLKDGNYMEAFNRFKAGFKLFKIKSLILVSIFIIPPFVYKILRGFKRKVLSYRN